MASHELSIAASIISQVALSFDGAVIGVAITYAAVRVILKFNSTSSALRKIRGTDSVGVADLRSVLLQSSDEEKLVIVRGTVQAKSAVDGNWKSLGRPSVLVSQESGDKAVIVQRTQTCIYNEWRGLLGLRYDLPGLLARSWKEKGSSSLRTVPFVLVEESAKWSQSDYVLVNVDSSRHPLPLTTVYHRLQPINATPYTFLQALFGQQYPVGVLDEEKILPLGKDISVVGLFSVKNHIPEIKSCKDLPYFLSDLTKDQMVADLAFKKNMLLWSSIILSSFSVGILGYAIVRNWRRWKHRQSGLQSSRATIDDAHNPIDDANPHIALDNDESREVPDGELCVICLMRRRRSAFIPCGHLVCCPRCALSVEHEVTPKCPVCRQTIESSVRIYDS